MNFLWYDSFFRQVNCIKDNWDQILLVKDIFYVTGEKATYTFVLIPDDTVHTGTSKRHKTNEK